ncbi:MAG: sulfatase [bacterium]
MVPRWLEVLTVVLTGGAATIYLVLLVQLFFTGLDEFELFGVTVKLRPWWKPLWIGTLLWTWMLAAASKPPPPLCWLRTVCGRVVRAAGVPLSRPGMAWALAGAVIGAVMACLASYHFYYLFPQSIFRIAATIAGAALLAALHYLFFVVLHAGTGRLLPGISEWRGTSLRLALYVIIWAALLSGPLTNWEALGTDPFAPHALAGLVSGLVLAWVMFAKWRLPGPAGRLRKASVPALLLVVLGGGLYSLVFAAPEHKGRAPDRVLFITIDTTRSDFLSCYGYGRQTSPNLDRLAESGVRFTRAFCPRGVTDPSHASVLTGTYPRTHGLQSNFQKVAGEVASMAEVFQRKGYETVAITSRSHLHPFLMNIPGFSKISAPTLAAQSTSAFDAYRRFRNMLVKNAGKDLFIWLHFFDPHMSYKPHPGISDRFYEKDKGGFVGKKILDKGESVPPSEIKYARDMYAGEIFYMDHYLGKSVRLLRNKKPLPRREPFILVIADHGEALGDYRDRPARFAFGHGGVLYNASANVPFIISWPGHIPEGKVVKDLVESVDVAPTMLDYCLDYRDFPAQGMSLRGVMEKEESTDNFATTNRPPGGPPDNSYYSSWQHAVIKNDYKLILPEEGEAELYNLSSDWKEEHNLADEREDTVKELTRELSEWKDRTPKTDVSQDSRSKAEINVLKALGYVQ